MRKKLLTVITMIVILFSGSGFAASYTLPEKLEKQITYGSGISGSFRITAEGSIAETPFIKAVSDAEYSIRGLVSGTDFLCSIFQADQLEQQTACSELYREEKAYYLRSDMVQGKVLQLPDLTAFVETLFQKKGENPSPASFIAGLAGISETDGSNTMESILSRYRYDLELWLSKYVTEGVFVKLEDGQSAFDSSYNIPIQDFKNLIIKLMGQFTSDPEVSEFLDTVMTPEQKAVYMNGNLLYFYEEALNALDLRQDVRINRRATTLGAVISTDLILPLDQQVTGYHTLSIHSQDQYITYMLQGDHAIFAISVPEKNDKTAETNTERSYWLTRINLDENNEKDNISVKLTIHKTTETHDDEESRSHQTDSYKIILCQDNTFVPEQVDPSVIPSFETIEANLTLHYSSKFAQNSSTKLEFDADFKQGNSIVSVQGSLKTVNSDSWVFKPFDISHPVQLGADKADVFTSYMTDWISNASTMIHHIQPSTDIPSETQIPETAEENDRNDIQEDEEPGEEDNSEDAEAAPLPDADAEN